MANGTSEEERAAARRREKLRNRGTPSLVKPEEFERARNLLLKARQFGMDDAMISAQLGMNQGGIYKIRSGRVKTVRRDTYNKIMTQLRPEMVSSTVHPTKGKVPDGAMQDPTGTQRRLQALRADGWPLTPLAASLGVTIEAVSELSRVPRKGVYRTTHLEVKAMYEKLRDADPADHGVTEEGSTRSILHARRKGWAPSTCWDDDTIDDPKAVPEWTGACGTEQGYFLHLKYNILVGHTRIRGHDRRSVLCKPCREARTSNVMSAARKYADDEREAALAMIDSGMTVRAVAEAMKCSTRTVERFKRERRDRGSAETEAK